MSVTLSILGTFVFIYIIFRIRSFLKYRNKINSFPGPKPCNLIAKLFGNACNCSHDVVEGFYDVRKIAAEFGETYHLWYGHRAFLNLIEPDDMEALLTSTTQLEKGEVYKFLQPWLKLGLLTSSGTKWQSRRKILTPAFHFNILKRFLPIISRNGEDLVHDLKDGYLKDEVDVSSLMSRTSLKIICEAAMGTTLDYADEKHIKYREAIYGLSPIIVERFHKIWLYYDAVFNLTDNARQQQYFLKHLHGFTKEVIAERERNFEQIDLEEDDDLLFKKKTKRLAMLDLLIDAKKNSGVVNDAGICEEVDTFMFRGHDTTAVALSYILLVLANYTDVQEKVYNEMANTTSLLDDDKPLTMDELQSMNYLDRAVKETLRLYPSVPFITRKLTEDIQLKNHVAPAGTEVLIHIFDLHRNPRVFPDPLRFDPDRFLPDNVQRRHPFAYIPFSAGSRNCIGQRFAMLELKNVVCLILKHFILEPVTKIEDIVFKSDLVLRTTEPIRVKFKSRKYSSLNMN